MVRALRPLAKAFCALTLFCHASVVPGAAHGGKSVGESSYSALIKEQASRYWRDDTDEVAAAIEIIGANDRLSSGEIVARIRNEMPEIDPSAPVRVPGEVQTNIVSGGDEVVRVRGALSPLLKYLRLEGGVRIVLFRSEVPVMALSPPNGLMVSTRSLALLSDEELRAVAAHELCHLLLTSIFRAAVDAGDYRTMRVIELFCDAAAAAVTKVRGENPCSLIEGLTRLQGVLEVEFGETGLKGKHPTLGERSRLSKELCRRWE